MKRLDLARFAPVGYDWRGKFRDFFVGLALSFLSSLRYLFRLRNARNALFYTSRVTGQRLLREGAVMEDFAALIDGCLTFFPALALCAALTAALHYAYHRRGSRSDYTMRRLPDRWEMHRRCLTLPLCGALASLAAWALVFLVYFGIYFLATPAPCLTAGQWAKIWTMEVGK